MSRRPFSAWTLRAAGLAAAHLSFLLLFFAPAISTPDANSYFGQAKLLALHGRTYALPESPVQYMGPHWGPDPRGRVYCTHPPGLALLLAAPYRLLGPKSAALLNPLLCSASLLLLFLLARLWSGERLALLAAGLMALNPFANEHAHFGDAHSAVSFLLLGSLLGLETARRSRPWWPAALGGLFAGMIPSVRTAEAVWLPVLALFAVHVLRSRRAHPRALLAAAFGAALPLLLLALRNHDAFGAFWRTGYADTGEQTAFGLSYLLRNAPGFVLMLSTRGAGLLLPLGLAGLWLMCLRRRTVALGLLLSALTLSSVFLYTSYYWPPDPQSMRFLIPTFHLYAIAGVWLLRARAWRADVRVASTVLLALNTLWGLPQSVFAMGRLRMDNAGLARLTSVLEEDIPEGSLVLAPEGISQHLDFIGRWRLADMSILEPLGPGPGAPSDTEGAGTLIRRLAAGRGPYRGLAGAALFSAFSKDLWAWAGVSRRVFWLMPETELERRRDSLPAGERLSIVRALRMPPRPLMGHPPAPGSPPAQDALVVAEWSKAENPR